jgi:hypothetical protein
MSQLEREREARQLLEEKVAELRRMSDPELRTLPGFLPKRRMSYRELRSLLGSPKVSMIDRLRARLGGERLLIFDGDPREVEEIDGPLGNPYHVVTSPGEHEDGRIHVAILVIDASFLEEQLPDLRADLLFSPDGSVERTLLYPDNEE